MYLVPAGIRGAVRLDCGIHIRDISSQDGQSLGPSSVVRGKPKHGCVCVVGLGVRAGCRVTVRRIPSEGKRPESALYGLPSCHAKHTGHKCRSPGFQNLQVMSQVTLGFQLIHL